MNKLAIILMTQLDNKLNYNDMKLLQSHTNHEVYYYINDKNKNIYKYISGVSFTICNEYHYVPRSRL